MRYLVKVHKVDPNSQDTKRLTPLHTLSMSGHADAIKELVQVGEKSVHFAVHDIGHTNAQTPLYVFTDFAMIVACQMTMLFPPLRTPNPMEEWGNPESDEDELRFLPAGAWGGRAVHRPRRVHSPSPCLPVRPRTVSGTTDRAGM
jgi:hypothetical protein